MRLQLCVEYTTALPPGHVDLLAVAFRLNGARERVPSRERLRARLPLPIHHEFFVQHRALKVAHGVS